MSVAVFVCLGWLVSVCLHEFGHAIVAYWGGDTSVKDKGYLTLNPLKYTHPLLSIILPFIFLLLGGIALPGAAVYIDQRRLRSRWWQSAVSAAGPAASLLVTLLFAAPFWLGLAPSHNAHWLWSALAFLIVLKVYFIVFNLLPIPPLDGYGIIVPWLPNKIQIPLRRFGLFGLIFLFMLLWIVPLFNLLLLGSAFIIAVKVLGVPPDLIWQGIESFDRWAIALLGIAVTIFWLLHTVIRKPQAVCYYSGSILSAFRRYKKALASYEKAIQFKPDYCEAWQSRGWLLRHLQRYDEAIASFDKAIEIKPNSYEAWYGKGYAITWGFNRMQSEQALTSFDKAIEFNPDYYEAWSQRGWVLYFYLSRSG